jgi:hypothetical protein
VGAKQGSTKELIVSEGVTIAIIVAIVIAALFIPFRLPARKRPKKRYLSTFGSVMGAINEIYLPSAHQSGQVIEEQRMSRTAIPGAPDPLQKAKAAKPADQAESP